MQRLFQIVDFVFLIEYEEDLQFPENFLKFEIPHGEARLAYRYKLAVADRLKEPENDWTLQMECDNLKVLTCHEQEIRYIGRGFSDYYALYREISPVQAVIFLRKEDLHLLPVDTVCTSLFALERRLLQRDAIILHCAYIARDQQAVLFSAPSGTGKSTQAALWEKYRGSATINGDRSLIRYAEGCWTANGWPVCGSSEICHNVTLPIRCIVMLQQAEDNQIRRLTGAEAFSQVYAQLTINRWSREDTMYALNLLDQLLAAVPVYLLECTISEEAVQCLEQELEKR